MAHILAGPSSASDAQPTCVDCEPGSSSQTTPPPVTEDVMDPKTFTRPNLDAEVHVVIEYCNRCRWSARATWVQTEILATFSPSGDSPETADESPTTVSAVTIIPRSNKETAGRFRIWLYKKDETEPHLIHDRKTDGGFAEMKVIKQRIREIIHPDRDLGHSDKH